ncbi:class I SAM-dependent methyltransferase [Hymenobacter sp. AT01-02]|uniref:class I SAM-dependent methyltransferase n=1 Tax=Hymenobacter sp. AT01-02 TaxID=1571877 RepID=UPI0006E43ABB|nr:class I SAM-dependent methyltransferase [Hymenobacter sp. AT01-02]
MSENPLLVAVGEETQVSVTAGIPQTLGAYPEEDGGSMPNLFDCLASTYHLQSILSGGLTERWRRQMVARLPLQAGQKVVDLMTGTGELWTLLLPQLGENGRVRAVDFSARMLAGAARHRDTLPNPERISLHAANACSSGLASATADVVVSAFGLKTLPTTDYPALAAEIMRLLAPGGTVALLELTVPARGWRRAFCLGYLRSCNYLLRLLGGPILAHTHLLHFASEFSALDKVASACRAAGLRHVRIEQLTFGLASILLAERDEQ